MASRPRRRVLVSGASIAGPVLAHGLVRRGDEVVLLERSPRLRRGGHAVDIRGKAFQLIERMGLAAAVEAARTRIETMSLVTDPRGKTIEVDIGALKRSARSRQVEIVRDDLVRILFQAVKDDVEVVFGDSVRDIADRGGVVDVTFDKGSPRSFDLVVGADGQRSTTREIAFGPEARFAHHLGAAVAIYGVDNLLGLRDQVMMYNTPGRGAAIYTTAGNQTGKVVLVFRTGPLGLDPRDADGQKRALVERFAGMGWEVPRLLEALPGASDFYFDEMSQIRMDRWSRGRVVLLGDAAHGPSPLSGQGTTLAIVGATALAEALEGNDLLAALAGWERGFRPYVRDNQAIAQAGKRVLIPASRPAIWLRNQAFRLLPLLARLGLGFAGKIERASG